MRSTHPTTHRPYHLDTGRLCPAATSSTPLVPDPVTGTPHHRSAANAAPPAFSLGGHGQPLRGLCRQFRADTNYGHVVLSAVNGSPPPGVLASDASCGQLLLGATLYLLEGSKFELQAQLALDCTRSGGTRTDQALSLDGSYEQTGQAVILTLPGATPIRAHLDGPVLTGTIPASPVTFVTPVALTFTQLLL